ncbi:phage baseplate protein [Algicola sagamiensis]|uniref:phage baseplate protein n=1 Tax=Algicola sagamiensis TaxID=163869 RepID=UPI00037E7876|nr:phage baseplate protein [Algicola sagamiensis]
MIGIDRQTGHTIDGLTQLVSRIQQVLTTTRGSREKRRCFGSNLPASLGKNQNAQQCIDIQSSIIAAFYEPQNGLLDFFPLRCQATRHMHGFHLRIEGKWHARIYSLEVDL